MTHLLLRWMLSSLGLILVAEIVPGITITGLYPALIAAFFLGLCNMLIRPILFVLTLPITIVTLGLFAFVINAALFWFVASFVEGFAVKGFLSALIGSLLMSMISVFANRWIKANKQEQTVTYKEIRD